MPKLRNDDPVTAAVERCANLTMLYFFEADETRAAELEAESAAAFVAVVRAKVARRQRQMNSMGSSLASGRTSKRRHGA